MTAETTLRERIARGVAEPWETRLWPKIEIGACWVWREGCARTRDGYGQFWLGGQMRLAHRVVYELLVGPIPDGLHLDHLCRNRACVKPDHLEPVSNGENQARGMKSYALRDKCRRGLHDITDPTNLKWNHGRRSCRACANARVRELRKRQAEALRDHIRGLG